MNKSALTNCKFTYTEFEETKSKVLSWIKQFSTFCFLDGNDYPQGFEGCIIGTDPRYLLRTNAGNALKELREFTRNHPGEWLFGHLGYDLKNETEALQSVHPDRVGFPDLHFFVAGIVIRLKEGEMEISAEDPQGIYEEIINCRADRTAGSRKDITVKQGMTKDEYIRTLEALHHHIHRGDCYEINFCVEFFAENTRIDPFQLYRKLNSLSPNPFSALYRMEDHWLICASPERFLKKTGNRLISQPMKGTISRDLSSRQNDEALKQSLYHSGKDRSENVMVVDLVRNDLSRISNKGSVKVEELYGIYEFPQVYQMVSTVSAELAEGVEFSDIIATCFPMGSMTGAPKKRVMELIENYERCRRGLFSGSVGYIDPNGDLDLNVVIRSVLFNEGSGDLSFQAGSGITYYSDPEKEWEECLLKASAIRSLLES